MDATEWEKRYILDRLPYPRNIVEWNGQAETALNTWLDSCTDVQITEVRQILTRRYPVFCDYDLSAKFRARSKPLVQAIGCQGDIMIDGTCGMHMANSGMIYDRMWYGRQVAVVTLRCHEGHASHFVSWRVPGNHAVALDGIRDRIMQAWDGGYYRHDLRLNAAFSLLTSKLR